MQTSSTGSNIGWLLLFVLSLAVGSAISLAVQTDTGQHRNTPPYSPPPRAIPICDGLYDHCCQEWDDNWGPCLEPCDDSDDWDERDRWNHRDDRDDREGLFDAEEHFADRRRPNRC